MNTKAYTTENKSIRAHFLRDPRNVSVTVQNNGHVIVTTTRPRGDGGATPWKMFAGFRDDILRDIANA